MSSVPAARPAARIDGLARPGRAALRVVETDPLELYPSLFQAIRDVWHRARSTAPPRRTDVELGRTTGARV